MIIEKKDNEILHGVMKIKTCRYGSPIAVDTKSDLGVFPEYLHPTPFSLIIKKPIDINGGFDASALTTGVFAEYGGDVEIECGEDSYVLIYRYNDLKITAAYTFPQGADAACLSVSAENV